MCLCLEGGGCRKELSTFVFEIVSFFRLELASSPRLTGQQGPWMLDLPVSLVLELKASATMLSYMGSEPSNSGPWVCKTSPLLTEPPPTPSCASPFSHSGACQESSLLEMSFSGPRCSMEVGCLRSKDPLSFSASVDRSPHLCPPIHKGEQHLDSFWTVVTGLSSQSQA